MGTASLTPTFSICCAMLKLENLSTLEHSIICALMPFILLQEDGLATIIKELESRKPRDSQYFFPLITQRPDDTNRSEEFFTLVIRNAISQYCGKTGKWDTKFPVVRVLDLLEKIVVKSSNKSHTPHIPQPRT